MEKFAQAKALVAQPLTLEEVRRLDQLERQAKGKEKTHIGALWDAVYAAVHPVVLHQARVEGLM